MVIWLVLFRKWSTKTLDFALAQIKRKVRHVMMKIKALIVKHVQIESKDRRRCTDTME